jgi:hypothetical protein
MPKGEKVKLLWENPDYRNHMMEAHRGKSPNNALNNWRENGGESWNKGTNIQTNNALDIWRENGGTSWNKGKIGVMPEPWNKGKKLSEEHVKKLVIARKRVPIRNWKGGITPINNHIRGSLEYKLWSDSVLNRDGNRCKKCGYSFVSKLVAHHILNFSSHIELRFAIDNGITFCRDCHKEFHRIYKKRNNNMEQVKEFIELNGRKR